MTSCSNVEGVVEPLTIPTYPLGEPEKNPLFFEKRVYQGSCGKVYPVPFIDKVYDDPIPLDYRSVRLENDFVRLVLLPEIGGRIFIGQDKTNNDYDFFYRQDVIKPALVGLAGPWISGGVEFNWPQHHRPGTYMPADFWIENEADGACTVWMSEHDPINRLKGMHGIRLRPESSCIELRARLYNRTPFTHTFLWWANVAARVHDNYQSFFPEDVHYVADHAVRAMSSFPLANNPYYGVDYASRPGENDLSWYKNIPVPTSYMVCQTDYDFFGGYDYDAKGGFLHIADRHISPGKKQWTWGNHEFGWAWDRELTDENGPYVELMAGVYTDNQPDFTYLRPGEVKTFRQMWWPYQKLGPVQQADDQLALRLKVNEEKQIHAGIAAAEPIENATIRLTDGDNVVEELQLNLTPGQPWESTTHRLSSDQASTLQLSVYDSNNNELLSYRPIEQTGERNRVLATEPPMPDDIQTVDELYWTAEHLEQYRHPTRYPEAYLEEALNRDSGDARSNLALGKRTLLRGQLDEAEQYLIKACKRITHRHPNPETAEAHYQLALTYHLQNKPDKAYPLFAKATWDYAWRTPGYLEMTAIDLRRGQLKAALEHAEAALDTNRLNNKAVILKAIALRLQNKPTQAAEALEQLLKSDALDFWALWELSQHMSEKRDEFFNLSRNDAQTIIDLAFDYAQTGQYTAAIELIEAHHAKQIQPVVAVPNPMGKSLMTHYLLAWLLSKQGNDEYAKSELTKAHTQSCDYFFPSRIQEQLVLEWALEQGPDGHAAYALGNYCYDRKRHKDAISYWEQSISASPNHATAHRNLGMAYWNVQCNGHKARSAYLQALSLLKDDARLVSEYSQLCQKLGDSSQKRLAFLEDHKALTLQRDDACVDYATLLNDTGKPEQALELLEQRRFHPWEGGEGQVLAQFTRACLIIGEQKLNTGDAANALAYFRKAMDTPQNLGEAYHLLQAKAHVNYWIGKALSALGRNSEAIEYFNASANEAGDFQQMAVTEHSELTYYRCLSLMALGMKDKAHELAGSLKKYAQDQINEPAKIDYFATSLPNLLVFEENLEETKNRHANQLLKLADKTLSSD